MGSTAKHPFLKHSMSRTGLKLRVQALLASSFFVDFSNKSVEHLDFFDSLSFETPIKDEYTEVQDLGNNWS